MIFSISLTDLSLKDYEIEACQLQIKKEEENFSLTNKYIHIFYVKKIIHRFAKPKDYGRKIFQKTIISFVEVIFVLLFNNNLRAELTRVASRLSLSPLSSERKCSVYKSNERTYNVVHRDPNEIQATLSLDNPTEC